MDIEIVTIFHNERNRRQADDLLSDIEKYEPGTKVHLIDNMKVNRGFSRACNLGAERVESEVIGFLNPDLILKGPFKDKVIKTLSERDVVITGERFGKHQRELRIWGCKDWCCGAAFFVNREWFLERGGFDERFVMYYEETDMVRQAQKCGKRVKSISLPMEHDSPQHDSLVDVKYKRKHFKRSADLFTKKWGRARG